MRAEFVKDCTIYVHGMKAAMHAFTYNDAIHLDNLVTLSVSRKNIKLV